MTDHARPPEGVETKPVVIAVGIGGMQVVSGPRLTLGTHKLVPLSALLTEREAKERAEATTDLAGRLMDALRERCEKAEAARDAAVARAEQAERDVEKLIGDYRAALDEGKREWDRAEQAERSLAELQERYTDLAKRAGCKRAECVVLEEERDEARKMSLKLCQALQGIAGFFIPADDADCRLDLEDAVERARAALSPDPSGDCDERRAKP